MEILKKIFNVTFLFLFFVISVIAVSTVIAECFYAGILVIPAVIFGLSFAVKRSQKAPLQPRKHLWPILQLVSTGVMLYFAFILAVCFSWDWGDLIRTAYKITMGEGNPLIEYYARYPNNRFWLTCLTGLFKLIKLFVGNPSIVLCKVITVLFSVSFVQLTIFLIYKTAQKLWNAEKAFWVGCAALLFLPFYLYSQFAYTDTSGMLLIACLTYLYVHYRQSSDSKRKVYLLAAAIGGISGLLYQIKIMGFIVTIAVIVEMVLSVNSLKKLKTVLLSFATLVVSFICVVGATNALSNLVVPISDELYDQYEFPMSHWVMMGLGKTGGYRQVDVDYTISFPTYDEKVEGTIAEINNRLSQRGFYGTFHHIVIAKMARTWGNDHFAGADYIHRYPVYPDSWMHSVFDEDGELGWLRDLYTGPYHIAMISGILLAAFFALRRKKEDSLLFARIALFGMILFMMIWECNSRYLLIFSPLLLLCGCDGWFSGIRFLRRRAAIRS